MRFAIAAALAWTSAWTSACACHAYDPVDDIPHLELADTATAIRAILAGANAPRVYAVGEYHPVRDSAAQSPLVRFTDEIIELLEPRARHLVVEAWLDPRCLSDGDPIGAQVQAVIGRPASTQADLGALVAASQRRQIETHGLPVTCIEHSALLDPRGRVDFLRLLQLVTWKLHDTTRALLDQGRDVIVYGGALHNDLHPRWPFAELSYAVPLASALGGRVLELDLVVPEVVAPLASIRSEPWFPLLGRAAPERVVVWRRADNSFVVILPAHSDEPARVARPIAAR